MICFAIITTETRVLISSTSESDMAGHLSETAGEEQCMQLS